MTQQRAREAQKNKTIETRPITEKLAALGREAKLAPAPNPFLAGVMALAAETAQALAQQPSAAPAFTTAPKTAARSTTRSAA